MGATAWGVVPDEHPATASVDPTASHCARLILGETRGGVHVAGVWRASQKGHLHSCALM
jgi:hypothetical protein